MHVEQREQHGTDAHTGAETALVAVFYVFTMNIVNDSNANNKERDGFRQPAFHLHLVQKTSLRLAQFLLLTVNAIVLQ